MANNSFVPNLSDGPCLFCGESSPDQPEELVRCDLCRRSAHLACLGSDQPQRTLLADNFYNFVCRACGNSEHDTISRAKMTGVQVLLLVLYNLHVREPHSARNGFYHWKIHIYNFINHNWKEIYGPESRKKKKKMVQASISGQLSHYSLYFTSGHSTLKEGGWYRLEHPLPPATLLARLKFGKTIESQTTGLIKIEPKTQSDDENEEEKETAHQEEDEEGRKVSWFAERAILKPEMRPPLDLFDSGDEEAGERDMGKEVHIKEEIVVKEEEICYEEEMDVVGEFIDVDQDNIEPNKLSVQSSSDELAPCSKPSLFNKSSPARSTSPDLPLKDELLDGKRSLRHLTSYEERELLKKLETGPLSPHLYRLRRKLAVRKQKMEHGLGVWNLDAEVRFLVERGRMRTRRERQQQSHTTEFQPHNNSHTTRVLDRFQVCSKDVTYKKQDENTSFLVRLGGQIEDDRNPIYSPYTLRRLKPFIMRDYESEPVKLRLLVEIVSYPHLSDPSWSPPPRPPLDYCYVTPRHVPAINQLARQFFWPGIDLSEVLQYPDHTCVVMFRRLVVGFGVVVPDTGFNEAYLSYLLVHPEWRRAGIATFILYHLIQTCTGKDITLHVSATNPALILYQRFGFKVEEFLSNFYDKYLPEDSPECKHAMFLRLSR